MVGEGQLKRHERFAQAFELLSKESPITKLAKIELRDVKENVIVVEPKGTLYLSEDNKVVINLLFRAVLRVLSNYNQVIFFNLKGSEQTEANLSNDFPGIPVVNKPEWRNLLFDIATAGPEANIAETGNFIRVNEKIGYHLDPRVLDEFFWNVYELESKTRDVYSKSLLPLLKMKGIAENRKGGGWSSSADDFLPPVGIAITPSSITSKSYEGAIKYYCPTNPEQAFENTVSLIKNIKGKAGD
jgi:hypothetical protein